VAEIKKDIWTQNIEYWYDYVKGSVNGLTTTEAEIRYKILHPGRQKNQNGLNNFCRWQGNLKVR
jgi:hypothetical protein